MQVLTRFGDIRDCNLDTSKNFLENPPPRHFSCCVLLKWQYLKLRQVAGTFINSCFLSLLTHLCFLHVCPLKSPPPTKGHQGTNQFVHKPLFSDCQIKIMQQSCLSIMQSVVTDCWWRTAFAFCTQWVHKQWCSQATDDARAYHGHTTFLCH